MAGDASTSTSTMTGIQRYLDNYKFPFINDCWHKYEKIAKIGQGTFGEVFKARDKANPTKLVALKKILMENEKEGFPITALREIKMLMNLKKHKNITELIEICSSKPTPYNRSKATFYLVLAFCEHDLAGLLSNKNVKFSMGDIKSIMYQLLEGLYFIHRQKVIHRDMKAANILIAKNGTLKLADFGLARLMRPQGHKGGALYTNRVVTLWYRPPELLLGERNYGFAIDLWGAGCIMAELWTRCPIMQGDTEQKQLHLISQLCGSINSNVWPSVGQLPLYSKMELPQNLSRKVQSKLLPYVKDQKALELIDALLKLDPSERPTAEAALDNHWFYVGPDKTDLKVMLSKLTTSMFEFTAPRRGGGGQGGHKPLPGRPSKPQGSQDSQLTSMIF